MTAAPYCPPGEGTPGERVAAFVDYWRDQPWNFDPHPEFDSSTWELTGHLARRLGVQTSLGDHSIHFVTLRAGSPLTTPMSPLIGAFARAWVKATPGQSYSAHCDSLDAVRCIEAVMPRTRDEGTACQGEAAAHGLSGPGRCTIAVLDEAAAFATGSFGTRARTVTAKIGRVAAFLDANGMTASPVGGWSPPAAAARAEPERSGAEFESRRSARLPSDEFLGALQAAYGLATDPADVIVVSVAALLLSASGRINEALAIEPDAWVEAATADGSIACGLRWRGSKGFPDHVKWLLPEMIDVARDALQRLDEVTIEGRRMKAWYDARPNRLYLPPHLEFLRGRELLAASQTAALLGKNVSEKTDGYVIRHGLARVPTGVLKGAASTVSFASIEAHVLRRLPYRMRDAGGPSSHPLLIVPEGTFQCRMGGFLPSPCMFTMVSAAQIWHGLNALPGRVSVFERLGLDPKSRIGAGTHMLRHFNETEKAAGLSPDDQAVWAGRANKRQNAVYDHEPPARLRALVSRAKRRDRDNEGRQDDDLNGDGFRPEAGGPDEGLGPAGAGGGPPEGGLRRRRTTRRSLGGKGPE